MAEAPDDLTGLRLRRRRVFIEHVDPEALAAPRTLELIDRFRVEPIVAIPPARMAPDWSRALRAVAEAAGGVGLWPLLSDDDGYWINASNLEVAERHVDRMLEFARGAGLGPRTICLDVEPPLEVMRSSRRGKRAFVASLARSRLPLPLHAAAERRFSAWTARLRDREVEVYVVRLPWPGLGATWDRWVGVLRGVPHVEALMTYSTLARPHLYSDRLTSAWLYASAWLHARRRVKPGPVPALALGCVGPGKLDGEPTWPSAESLQRDVAAARRAGLDDLALFSLEGVLSRPDPKAWMAAFAGRPSGS